MTDVVDKGLKKMGITISKPALAVLCIVFGIIVIVFPSALSVIVGLFLISRRSVTHRTHENQKSTKKVALAAKASLP